MRTLDSRKNGVPRRESLPICPLHGANPAPDASGTTIPAVSAQRHPSARPEVSMALAPWRHLVALDQGRGNSVEREHRVVTRVEEFNAPGGVVCIAPKKSRHPRFMLYRGAAKEGRKSGKGYVVSASLVRVRALTVILRALKERASTTIGLGANLNAR